MKRSLEHSILFQSVRELKGLALPEVGINLNSLLAYRSSNRFNGINGSSTRRPKVLRPASQCRSGLFDSFCDPCCGGEINMRAQKKSGLRSWFKLPKKHDLVGLPATRDDAGRVYSRSCSR
jgi:hypothetical protein